MPRRRLRSPEGRSFVAPARCSFAHAGRGSPRARSTPTMRSAPPPRRSRRSPTSRSRARCSISRGISSTPSAADFDPHAFHDRYEAALADLVKAKLEGRKIELPERMRPKPAADLLAALRESAMIGREAAGAEQGEGRAASPGVAEEGELSGWLSSNIAPSAISRRRPSRRRRKAGPEEGARRGPRLRRPETRRATPPLRFPSRTRRRLEKLGGDARPEPRAGREAPRGRRRGSPARIRRLRGHDSRRASMAAARSHLGPGDVVADRRSAQGARERPSRIRSRGREAERPLRPRETAREGARETRELAAHQAARRLRAGAPATRTCSRSSRSRSRAGAASTRWRASRPDGREAARSRATTRAEDAPGAR